MWEIDISNQAATFFYSIVLGGLLCLFYDVFRVFRAAFKHGAFAVFFEDITFWIVSAFLVFIFLLTRTNGELRGYVFVALLFGFVLMRLSFSKFFFTAFLFVFRAFHKISIPIGRRYTVFTKKMQRFCVCFSRKTAFFVKKAVMRLKKS